MRCALKEVTFFPVFHKRNRVIVTGYLCVCMWPDMASICLNPRYPVSISYQTRQIKIFDVEIIFQNTMKRKTNSLTKSSCFFSFWDLSYFFSSFFLSASQQYFIVDTLSPTFIISFFLFLFLCNPPYFIRVHLSYILPFSLSLILLTLSFPLPYSVWLLSIYFPFFYWIN